jgi:hypothetical protein
MAGRKRQAALVGFGIATLLAAGSIGALGAGCGGGNSNNGNSADGSMESSVEAAANDGGGDVMSVKEGGSEGGSDADAAMTPTGPFPRVFLVHASPNLPPVRFCFGVGDPTSATSFMIFPFAALPNSASAGQPFPGLFPGTGGEFKNPVPTDDLGTFELTLYVVNALAVANQTADAGAAELTCDQLIPTPGATGGTFLTPNVDFWQLNTIPAHTLMDGMSYVEAITGCLPGLPVDGGANSYCGAGYSTTTGNVGLTQFALDTTTTVDAGSMGVQFAQASTPWAAAVATLGPLSGAGVFTLVPPAADAGPDAGPTRNVTPILAQMDFGKVTNPTLTPFSGLDFTGASGAFAAIATTPTTPVLTLALPFPYITAFTYGADPVPDGGLPQNGKGFAFVLVGDPNQSFLVNPQDGGPIYVDAGAPPNLGAAHFLVFPTANP